MRAFWKGNSPFLGLAQVLLLYARILVLAIVISLFVRSLWPEGYAVLRFYIPALAFSLMLLHAFVRHPVLFALSTWKPTWQSVSAGALVGTAASATMWFVIRRWFPEHGHGSVPAAAFIGVACLSPVLEETFFRGLFLRSMKAYLGPFWAALLVAALAAVAHPDFAVALPLQGVLCLIYLSLGNSLPASMAAHIANNAWVFYWVHRVR